MAKLFYTLDGTDQYSRFFDKPVVLTETAIVKACAFFKNKEPSAIAEKTFLKVALLESEDHSALTPGIKYAYYENDAMNRTPGIFFPETEWHRRSQRD